MEHPPLLFSVKDAADQLSIGRTLLYELLAAGEIESVHIGRRVLIKRSELERFAAELAAA